MGLTAHVRPTHPNSCLARDEEHSVTGFFWYDFPYKGAEAVVGFGDTPPSHSERNHERCTLYPTRGEVCIHHSPSDTEYFLQKSDETFSSQLFINGKEN